MMLLKISALLVPDIGSPDNAMFREADVFILCLGLFQGGYRFTAVVGLFTEDGNRQFKALLAVDAVEQFVITGYERKLRMRTKAAIIGYTEIAAGRLDGQFTLSFCAIQGAQFTLQLAGKCAQQIRVDGDSPNLSPEQRLESRPYCLDLAVLGRQHDLAAGIGRGVVGYLTLGHDLPGIAVIIA